MGQGGKADTASFSHCFCGSSQVTKGREGRAKKTVLFLRAKGSGSGGVMVQARTKVLYGNERDLVPNEKKN